jgi:predicted esterase
MTFDELGEIIEHPNPTPALEVLTKTMQHLLDDCSWNPSKIHLLGFAQGGSVIAEFAIKWWKEHKDTIGCFGSLVTVSGPLLSYPTLSDLSTTPVLVVHRPAPAEPSLTPNQVKDFKKAYRYVQQVALTASRNGMPASKEEWEPIMRFWSEKLSRRQAEGLYEVMTGQS